MFEWVLGAAQAAALALLLDAALFKLVRPEPLRTALAELVPGFSPLASNLVVRFAAGLEIVVSLAFWVPMGRTLAATALGVLGFVFAGLGFAGRLRRVEVGCGCLGSGEGRALGLANVLIGLYFVIVSGLSLAVEVSPSPVTTAGLMVLLCVWLHRRVVRHHLVASRGAA